MKFTKMHGLGNDYVYVDGSTERVNDPVELARVISDRNTGVGSDGLILIHPSTSADVRMEMYNADGSRSEMCGNGIRCVAKYAVDHGLVVGPSLCIETDAGVRAVECQLTGGRVAAVRVNMGPPSLSAAAVGVAGGLAGDRSPGDASRPAGVTNAPLVIDGVTYTVTCVSMGNPHAVIFVDDLESIALETVGPRIEHAPEFPQRINAHFVRVDSPTHVTMRTWERGSGVTRACGTGACAVCVAGVVTERLQRKITATLPGGDLELEWSADGDVYMTGPAVEVFTGMWPD